jgi:hypothetical protein
VVGGFNHGVGVGVGRGTGFGRVGGFRSDRFALRHGFRDRFFFGPGFAFYDDYYGYSYPYGYDDCFAPYSWTWRSVCY